VFTSALVEGLRTGEADLDGDGLVALDELYDYVFDKVRERNPAQTPTKSIEMSGDLYLARSRRRSRLPEELLAALTAPNVFTRLGAVSGLREVLLGQDVPLATAARKELDRIAGREVPQVADAARAALRELAVVPSTRVIELTEASPTWLLRLDGPPLVRRGRWQVTDQRITVRPVEAGLEVSAPPGVRGELLITSDAGDIPIRVVATMPARGNPVPIAPAWQPPVHPPKVNPVRSKDALSPGQKPVAIVYAILGLVMGVSVLGASSVTPAWFGDEILLYTVVRLIESYRTGISPVRQRWVWGMCGLGALVGVASFFAPAAGYAVIFWVVAAVVECFGRLLDRIRAVAIAFVSVPTFVIIVAVHINSDLDRFLYVLNGLLPIALGLITLAPLLFRRLR
jgi:hypothetical protein